MARKVEIICKCGCGRKKMVRIADVKRGWGKFYSKSCKAIAQERRTGQHASFLAREEEREYGLHDDVFEEGWDGHKDTF